MNKDSWFGDMETKVDHISEGVNELLAENERLRAALAEKNEILSVFEWPDEGSTVDGGRLNHWHCRFCSAALLEGLHKEDCAWLKARKAGE